MLIWCDAWFLQVNDKYDIDIAMTLMLIWYWYDIYIGMTLMMKWYWY